MSEGLITGRIDYVPFIRLLIEKEAAFLLRWPDSTVGVVFRKGEWTLKKVNEKGETADVIGFSDSPSVTFGDNPLSVGLLDSLIRLKREERPDYFDRVCRELPSRVIIAFLGIWGGNLEGLKEVKVLKSGRTSGLNAEGEVIDEEGNVLHRFV